MIPNSPLSQIKRCASYHVVLYVSHLPAFMFIGWFSNEIWFWLSDYRENENSRHENSNACNKRWASFEQRKGQGWCGMLYNNYFVTCIFYVCFIIFGKTIVVRFFKRLYLFWKHCLVEVSYIQFITFPVLEFQRFNKNVNFYTVTSW